MKKFIIPLIVCFFLNLSSFARYQQAYQEGEELRFALYYNSGITGNVNAGEVVSKVKISNSNLAPKNSLRIALEGKTKGAFRWFFKAHDQFETYVDPESFLPSYFRKRIQEGNYTASRDVFFDQETGLITSINNKRNRTRTLNTDTEVFDLLSSLYYIRNWNFDSLSKKQSLLINIFLDDSIYTIQFEYHGKKTIETSLGKIRCLKFVPHVLTGNVFKDETPMVVYVSDDDNHLPILAVSDLLIGRVKIELVDFKGLSHPLVSSEDKKRGS